MSRPFAFNSGSPISGTEQIGYLAVGTPTIGFSGSGVKFFNGPSEDTSYIIAKTSSAQPTPIFDGELQLSENFKGSQIDIINSGSTVRVNANEVQSILSTTLINNKDKVMFSITFIETSMFFSSNSFIGVGNISMNFNNNGFPGNDNKSFGFSQTGQVWFNGEVVSSSAPTWNSGYQIDVAIDHFNGNIWIRSYPVGQEVGNWNNEANANPTTNSGGISLNGLTSVYPVLSPGSGGMNDGSRSGIMTIVQRSTYTLEQLKTPTGFQFAGTNQTGLVGFLKSQFKTDVSFVTLVNGRFNQSFALNSGGATSAKSFLNGQGYWTNYP